MQCLVEGHAPVTEDGKGKFEGRRSTYCARCGLVISNVEIKKSLFRRGGYETVQREAE